MWEEQRAATVVSKIRMTWREKWLILCQGGALEHSSPSCWLGTKNICGQSTAPGSLQHQWDLPFPRTPRWGMRRRSPGLTCDADNDYPRKEYGASCQCRPVWGTRDAGWKAGPSCLPERKTSFSRSFIGYCLWSTCSVWSMIPGTCKLSLILSSQ